MSFARRGSLNHLKRCRSSKSCLYVSSRNLIKSFLAVSVVFGPFVSLKPVTTKSEWTVTSSILAVPLSCAGRPRNPSSMSSLELSFALTCGSVPSNDASMTSKMAFWSVVSDLLAASRSSECAVVADGACLTWLMSMEDELDMMQSSAESRKMAIRERVALQLVFPRLLSTQSSSA